MPNLPPQVGAFAFFDAADNAAAYAYQEQEQEQQQQEPVYVHHCNRAADAWDTELEDACAPRRAVDDMSQRMSDAVIGAFVALVLFVALRWYWQRRRHLAAIASASASEADARVKRLEAEADALRYELTHRMGVNAALQQENAELKKQCSAVDGMFELADTYHQDEHTRLQEDLARLQDECRALTDDNARLQTVLLDFVGIWNDTADDVTQVMHGALNMTSGYRRPPRPSPDPDPPGPPGGPSGSGTV